MNLKKALSLAMAAAMVAGVSGIAASAKEYPWGDINVVDSGDGINTGYIVDGTVVGDTIVSDNAVFVLVDFNQTGGNQYPLADSDLFKFSSKKGDNAKLIKKISIVEKDLIDPVVDGGITTFDGRESWVKIEINEDMTDTEYKMNPSISFTFKKDKTIDGTDYKAGDKFTQTIKFWVKNQEIGGTDQTYAAGQKSQFAKPVKNDENEVVWADANRDLAKLTFTGDSDVKAYYPKLSTKWDNDVYAANFANGEAYKFEFVTGPTISATARPILTIYNPFINDDEEYTVDAAELTIYQLVDDEFINVTDKFTAGTDDDGNQVLTTKTRTLGFYVVCDEAAAASGEIITDEPAKEVPNTGR